MGNGVATAVAADELHRVLKGTFGFSSFRPWQEEIIRDLLTGHDVLALLPTGGGKSLCYQLPALLRPGLTLVVSPLIALMKDQVDSLTASGVAATFLNSTLEPDEAHERLRGLCEGRYRLLYVAPERLVMSGFLSELRRWNVDLVAVDEAHCISEWGHDFRPEYRQLAQLRALLPDAPLLAVTATATERVRADILQQLNLRHPHLYVASFNRENLTYRVVEKSGYYERLLKMLKARPRDSGIVYCHSRQSVERLAQRLNLDGIDAAPYHAGMEKAERGHNQDSFLRDDTRVICATIAFGMGVHKSNVRFVVHVDLPKNVESYYQETGRAGRDGLPGECVLFFSAGDVVKVQRFIDEKSDPEEQKRSRMQLQQMVHYAELSTCRRAALLRYFGEDLPGAACGGCDNCLSPRQTFEGTIAAQKLLSCIVRIRRKSDFSVGLHHLALVLTGADTEKIRQWGHEELSTYGIGREYGRRQWREIGRELIRQGFLAQTEERISVIHLTKKGWQALAERAPITLTCPRSEPAPAKPRIGEITCDEALFEVLRRLRRELADERGVPAYVVFPDTALRHMAAQLPTTLEQFSNIIGVGEKKLAEYGEKFIAAIAEYKVAGAKEESDPPVDQA